MPSASWVAYWLRSLLPCLSGSQEWKLVPRPTTRLDLARRIPRCLRTRRRMPPQKHRWLSSMSMTAMCGSGQEHTQRPCDATRSHRLVAHIVDGMARRIRATGAPGTLWSAILGSRGFLTKKLSPSFRWFTNAWRQCAAFGPANCPGGAVGMSATAHHTSLDPPVVRTLAYHRRSPAHFIVPTLSPRSSP